MYNCVYVQIEPEGGVYSLQVLDGQKVRVVGQGWWTDWFLYTENSEVPVLSQQNKQEPGVNITCEAGEDGDYVRVHVNYAGYYDCMTFVVTDGVTCEQELVTLNATADEIDGHVETVITKLDQIITALNTANTHLQAIETNTSRIPTA